MDVHSPKNGINRYWSIAMCFFPFQRETWNILKLSNVARDLRKPGAPMREIPGMESFQEIGRIPEVRSEKKSLAEILNGAKDVVLSILKSIRCWILRGRDYDVMDRRENGHDMPRLWTQTNPCCHWRWSQDWDSCGKPNAINHPQVMVL